MDKKIFVKKIVFLLVCFSIFLFLAGCNAIIPNKDTASSCFISPEMLARKENLGHFNKSNAYSNEAMAIFNSSISDNQNVDKDAILKILELRKKALGEAGLIDTDLFDKD